MASAEDDKDPETDQQVGLKFIDQNTAVLALDPRLREKLAGDEPAEGLQAERDELMGQLLLALRQMADIKVH